MLDSRNALTIHWQQRFNEQDHTLCSHHNHLQGCFVGDSRQSWVMLHALEAAVAQHENNGRLTWPSVNTFAAALGCPHPAAAWLPVPPDTYA